MFCDRCGAQVSGPANFCPGCGRTFSAPPVASGGRVVRHVRTLGILWLVYAGLRLMQSVAVTSFARYDWGFFDNMPFFVPGLLRAVGGFYLVLSILGALAGWGLLERRPVINFWASWCIPCRDEAPALQALWEQYREQGLVVVGVDYVDTEPEAKKFMQDFGITYPAGPDVGTRISQTYKITGVPETYFITREGKVLQGTDSTGRPLGNYIGAIPASVLGRV